MIQAINLSKTYNKTTVVNQVSLSIEEGTIFGLLGPNAAGKTTLIRMLCGIIEADLGEAMINGLPNKQAKADFGYVSQSFGQYEELTVWENLTFYAQMYGVTNKKRLLYLLERYGLTPFKEKFAGKLSGGYKRRLALTCALAHDPKVLFLDEPTAGIDPVTRKRLWDDFYELSSEGKTLFVTTHYMEEAERCHQLAFISAGSIVAIGTPQSIKERLGDISTYRIKIAYIPQLNQALLDLKGIILVNQFGNELHMVVQPSLSKEHLEQTIASIVGDVVKLKKSEANLEDVFIALTQNGGHLK